MTFHSAGLVGGETDQCATLRRTNFAGEELPMGQVRVAVGVQSAHQLGIQLARICGGEHDLSLRISIKPAQNDSWNHDRAFARTVRSAYSDPNPLKTRAKIDRLGNLGLPGVKLLVEHLLSEQVWTIEETFGQFHCG